MAHYMIETLNMGNVVSVITNLFVIEYGWNLHFEKA